MEVPVDYTKPGGDRFTLALRKAPALDQGQRVGSLVINPGGPGGSGVEYATYAQYVFSKQLRSVYDIVGFDPRGIGASDAVTCLTDTQMDTLFGDDPTPDTAAERRTLIDDADRITKSCAATGGERARHMGTTEVARDMDVMRVLLGDPKLNYFGVSYGTFLGALYADLFPKNVGRFVLDSAISPNQTDAQEMTYDIQGFESSIDAFISWCVARPDCALGSDEAAARGKIVSLLDTVEAKELETSVPGLAKVGEGWTSFAIFMCLYSEDSWPTLNKGLAQAFTGRGDILLAKAMSVVERSTSGRYADTTYLQAMIPVRCEDWPRSPETPGGQGRAGQGSGGPPALGPDDRRALRQLRGLARRRAGAQGLDARGRGRADPRHRQPPGPGDPDRRDEAAREGPRLGGARHFRPRRPRHLLRRQLLRRRDRRRLPDEGRRAAGREGVLTP